MSSTEVLNPQPSPGSDKRREERDSVVIRFCGDSGDGMQLVGTQFTNVSASPAPRGVWNVANSLPWNSTGEGASTADPDADGIVNLAEYFHGLNPRLAEQPEAAIVYLSDASSVGLRYRMNPSASDVTSRVERTADLRSGVWTTNGLAAAELDGDWSGWRSVSRPISSDTPQEFLRLIISE